MDKNRSYFMRRAAQERSAADKATGDASRQAHLELERRYRELVTKAPAQQQEPTASA